ncbi:MAG: UpxY family transcription antiterminator [Flavobacteriaceae bacterium]|nr:UpxY family transcription antiterminator [Flavobacteriaceae bacterium]
MKKEKDWYVLYVRSHHGKKVHESLQELSIESFFPQIKTLRNWSDRKKVIFKPLFPSYVFVKINSTLDFHKVLSIYGASAYLRFGKTYAKARDKEIDQIKLLLGDKDITNIQMNSQLPKIGETKRIASGPLSGLECVILKTRDVNKIIVRIDSLQQNISATIPLHYFEESGIS